MTLEQAAAYAEELAARPGDERELATLRARVGRRARGGRARHRTTASAAVAYRAIAQFRFRQKLELLRRGLDDESPAVRGSALIALESLSRDHPGDVNAFRPLLNELAARDPNVAVRRLAIVCFKNGTPDRGTIQHPRRHRRGRRGRRRGAQGGRRRLDAAREEAAPTTK